MTSTSLSRRLMVIRRTFDADGATRRISFPAAQNGARNARCTGGRAAPRLPAYLPAFSVVAWNVMPCDVRMYKHSYARWSRSKTTTYYLNLITANGALPRLENRFF